MEVKNAVMPTSEQMKGFFEDDNGQIICMINLLKFKEKAEIGRASCRERV